MHQAVIATLKNIQPISGADRIVQADVDVNGVTIAHVIVGIASKDRDIGIYFGSDLQLSDEYCTANDLIARFDEEGKKIGGGYLDHRRRITAQRFKGIKSEGLFMPLSSLDFSGAVYTYQVGTTLDSINGIEICKKYFNPKTATIRSATITRRRVEAPTFYEHVNTKQLIYYLNTIPSGAKITITEKLHGTSQRVGNVLIRKNLNWFQRLVNRMWPIFPYYDYDIVHGTRRVIIAEGKEGFHGKEDFRFHAVGYPDLEQDVIIYGEIVGYANNKSIMLRHDTASLKEVKKVFGETITYDYGELEDCCRFYVYRVTKSGKDLSWEEVCEVAKNYGYDTVPLIDRFDYNGNKEELLNKVRDITESNNNVWSRSLLCYNHIMEGVVLRIDHEDSTTYLKYKSYAFRVLEGITQANDEVVDMEEVA